MEKIVVRFVMLVLICMMLSCSNSGGITYKNKDARIEDRVDDLLARMTIVEKVAQMRMFHANQGIHFSENVKMELSDIVKQRLANDDMLAFTGLQHGLGFSFDLLKILLHRTGIHSFKRLDFPAG